MTQRISPPRSDKEREQEIRWSSSTSEPTRNATVASSVSSYLKAKLNERLDVPKREIKRANGRNRVKRQLRHLMRDRVADLPEGARVVVRASRKALGVPSKELGEHLDRVMARAWRKWDAR